MAAIKLCSGGGGGPKRSAGKRSRQSFDQAPAARGRDIEGCPLHDFWMKHAFDESCGVTGLDGL